MKMGEDKINPLWRRCMVVPAPVFFCVLCTVFVMAALPVAAQPAEQDRQAGPVAVQPPGPPEGEGQEPDREDLIKEQTLQRLKRRMDNKNMLSSPETLPGEMSSVFYTPEQYQLLLEAIERFKTRGPLVKTAPTDETGEPKDPGIRELSLSGIAYLSEDKWVVWLNGKRLTPKSLPEEVLDIDVHESYVDMKWYDPYTELIYPVRLRPHQRFNLDMRIFLPGNL